MKSDPGTGSKIGRFELLEELGQGSYALVFRALDTLLNREIALKLLKATLLTNEDDRERFFREAKAAALINHANICTIHDLGEDDGHPYIVMELLHGQTLAGAIKKRELPFDKIIQLAIDIALGLEAANDANIVHRDLKPSNIFVTEQGRAKILDFGLAKTFSKPGEVPDTALTQRGQLLGTYCYMSPEQIRGEALDHRSDIFSMGAVFYEMLTGERAFRDSNGGLFQAIQGDDPEPAIQFNLQVTPEIMAVLDHALKKAREKRYQDIRQMRNDLEAIKRGQKLDPSSSEAPTHLEGSTRDKLSSSRAPEPSATNSIKHCMEIVLESIKRHEPQPMTYEDVRNLFSAQFANLRPQLGRPLLRFFQNSFDRARGWLTEPIEDYAISLTRRLLDYIDHAHAKIADVAGEITLKNDVMVSDVVLTDFSAPVLRVLQRFGERFTQFGAVRVHLITSNKDEFNLVPDTKSWQEEFRKPAMKLYSVQRPVQFEDAEHLVFKPLGDRRSREQHRSAFVQGAERAYPNGTIFDFPGIAELSYMAAEHGLETYIVGECYKVQPLGSEELARGSGHLGRSLKGSSTVLSGVQIGRERKFISEHGLHGGEQLGLKPNEPLNCCYRFWRNFMERKNYPLGVIFDLDGTLLDSEPVHKNLYQEMAEQIGGTLSDEEYYSQAIGMTDSQTLEYLLSNSSRHVPAQERTRMIQNKQSEFMKILKSGAIPPVGGSISFLRNLSQDHFLLAVATSATAEEAEIALTNMGVRDLVHVVISSRNVKRGKPAPDVYETAVRQLGLHPKECLVYEDSPKGVQSAVGAGIAVVRVSDDRSRLPGSFVTIHNFEGHTIPELPVDFLS